MSDTAHDVGGARRPRNAAVHDFAATQFQSANADLLEQMLETVCRLDADRADRGDVKLMAKALAELRYALRVFAPYREVRKVSIFGSARTPPDSPDYLAAEAYARGMCERGWMVITGAGDGIMRAGHGGAGREASFGVAIRLPFEQKTNDIIADDEKLVNFRYFFTRKLMFLKEASAIALFPGGFGTQDEGFEALTLIQTGKAALMPVVLVERPGGGYWRHWRQYVHDELLGTGMISPQDLHLFHVTDSVPDAIAHVTRFYRVYHSMRYVGDTLVLRLMRPISSQTLKRINDEFAAKILSAGAIEASGPLPDEGDELPHLPRLTLRFDKRSCGLLRRMVDEINRDDPPADPERGA